MDQSLPSLTLLWAGNERSTTLASMAPGYRPKMWAMAWSTLGYRTEHICGLIPSLTLLWAGNERSKIKRQLPGVPLFGITPNLLTCTSGTSASRNGPEIFPATLQIASTALLAWGFAPPTTCSLALTIHSSCHPGIQCGSRLTDQIQCVCR